MKGEMLEHPAQTIQQPTVDDCYLNHVVLDVLFAHSSCFPGFSCRDGFFELFSLDSWRMYLFFSI